MTDRFICLQGLDVRAALDGKLTEITFPIVEQPPARFMSGDLAPITNTRGDGRQWAIAKNPERIAWPPGSLPGIQCPIGDHGDTVAVREAFLRVPAIDARGQPRVDADGRPRFDTWYRADDRQVDYYDDDASPTAWRPAAEMPLELSRLSLRITRVELERLSVHHRFNLLIEDVVATSIGDEDRIVQLGTAWDRRHGAGSWDANPWIWVVTVTPVPTDFAPLEIGR